MHLLQLFQEHLLLGNLGKLLTLLLRLQLVVERSASLKLHGLLLLVVLNLILVLLLVSVTLIAFLSS